MWTPLNSGDNITVAAGNLSYPGITPSGNSVTFDGAGMDAFLPFTDTTSGAVYASFAFSVTDLTNVTTDLASTYFAVLTDQTGSFTSARLYIRKSGTQYQFGLGAGTSADTWSTNLYNINTVQYLRIGYDFATNKIALFENQVTPLTPSIVVTPAAPITAIGGFALRQDAAATTPFIQLDELAISNNVIVLGVSDISNFNSNFVRNTLVKDEISFGSKSDVKVYNMNGQVVKSASVSPNKNLNLSELQNGMYIVTGMVNGTPVSQKILKK
ncbi:T9SS type A sorting domain-containing protein [Chryseobacterium sp.]|nr:T9SS type A sorting domain-containing protein [Chryseobacterium sp.]